MYALQEEVLYLNRPVYIVGIRQPTRYETEKHYDLARKAGSAKPDFCNIAARHIRYPTVAINTGMSCQVLELRK